MRVALLLHGEYGHVSWQMELTLGMVLVALFFMVWAILRGYARGQ